MDIERKTVAELLDASKATDAFKTAVRMLEQNKMDGQITFTGPPVKALRVICKLLETYPDRVIDRVSIKGRSGCSNYTGQAVVSPGDDVIAFDWDCAWRAGECGWTDFWGNPDQMRAAREYGYQCFRRFEEQ